MNMGIDNSLPRSMAHARLAYSITASVESMLFNDKGIIMPNPFFDKYWKL
jgi:hypothetical protein